MIRAPVAPALVLALALGVSGCGSGSRSTAGSVPTDPTTAPVSDGCTMRTPPPTTAANPAPIRISVLSPFTPPLQTAVEAVVANYNASQRRVVVTLDAAPGAQPGQPGKAGLASALATARRPVMPTIVVADGMNTTDVANSKLFVPASGCPGATDNDATSPLPSVSAAFSVGKTRWPGATTLDTPILFFNRSHLMRAGLNPDHPPRTLKELADFAAKLKVAKISASPLAFTLDPFLIENWLTGAGVFTVNHQNGRNAPASASAFDNTRTRELYQWVHDLEQAGLVDPIPTTAPATTALADLVTQKSSMVIASASAIGPIDAFVAGRGSAQALGLAPGTILAAPPVGQFDVAPLPGLDGPGRGQVAGDAWYVTAASTPDQRAAAWDFLRYLGGVESQVRLNLDAAVPPSNTKSVNDPGLQSVWRSTRRGHWLDTAYTQVTSFDVQAPGPSIGPYGEVGAAIGASLAAMSADTSTPAEAVAAASKGIDAALATYAQAHPPP